MNVRTIVAGCLALLGALAPVPAYASGPVPVVVRNGKGWGPGVGMAQDGAYWMSRAGASTNQILGHFYPGAGLGRASGTVQVVVLSGRGADTVVGFPGGGQVRDDLGRSQSPGFPVAVPAGGQVRLHTDGGHDSIQPLNFAQVATFQAFRSGDAATTRRPLCRGKDAPAGAPFPRC